MALPEIMDVFLSVFMLGVLVSLLCIYDQLKIISAFLLDITNHNKFMKDYFMRDVISRVSQKSQEGKTDHGQ